MDGLMLNAIATFSVEQAASLSRTNLVQKLVIWDYQAVNEEAPINKLDNQPRVHGLIGLCACNLLNWISFSDQQGFELLIELHNQLQPLLPSNDYDELDKMLWSITGYSHKQSPIVISWSLHYVLLLRIQLHRDYGPMIMRSKLLGLSCGDRVVSAQALPMLPTVRSHQVLIVLSSGFAFTVKL